jgi:beta-ureidopropionase / N-carbamoyl-L-amino-acid hydrolase
MLYGHLVPPPSYTGCARDSLLVRRIHTTANAIPEDTVRIDRDRLLASLDEMARIGVTPNGGVTRLALTDEDRAARDLLRSWLEEAGCTVRVDDAGNMYGHRAGTEALPPVLVGSHLDTVRAGGRFDGVLGVLGGLEVVRTLDDRGVTTRHPVEIVNWTNEEGARFNPALLGSGAVTGQLDLDYVYGRTDADGHRFEDELRRIGYLGSADNRPVDAAAFLELHVEQGPVLERAGLPVGVVEGIIGDTWIDVTILGKADHAGPTPMDMRHDALLAASEIVQGVNRIARDAGDPAVGTVGRLDVQPNIINTISDRVAMVVDLRNLSPERLDDMVRRLEALANEVARRHGVRIEIDRYWTIEPVDFAPHVIETIAASCRELGLEPFRLWSGAGHDAKYAASRWPTAMIFVRSRDGLSHAEGEFTAPDDIEAATNVLLGAVTRLAGADTP